MKTLGDAWEWYNSANRNLRRMQRLGRRNWDDESLESSSIAKDQTFKEVSASTILRETELALEPIDDLGILVGHLMRS